jgi:hypothetical protein
MIRHWQQIRLLQGHVMTEADFGSLPPAPSNLLS